MPALVSSQKKKINSDNKGGSPGAGGSGALYSSSGLCLIPLSSERQGGMESAWMRTLLLIVSYFGGMNSAYYTGMTVLWQL